MNLFGQTKSNISRTASVLGVVGLSAIALLSVAKPAGAASVALGSDYWITQDSSSFNFGGPIGIVNFVGVPIGTFNERNVGSADTIVQRTQDVTFNNGSGTTPIEVVALSLKSKNSVTLPGLGNFDIFVGLTPGQKSTGTLTINENKTFNSDFNVNWTATFKPTSGGDAIACPLPTSCNLQIRLAGNGNWSDTFQGGTRVEGLLGDQLANVHTNLPSDTTDFFTLGTIKHDASGAGHHDVTFDPVPEPLTIIGSGIAAGFGIFFKKEAGKKRKKQTVS